MITVKVLDTAEMGAPEKLPGGMLRVPARLTRTGVFPYTQPDGSVMNVLRMPADVFAADSLKSFELAPLTLRHPPGEVNSKNYKTYTVGSVAHVQRDPASPDFVSAVLLIADAEAVAAVNAGIREISSGYFADLEPAPEGAEFKDSVSGATVPYQFVHKNIRGNHVALVEKGRAGPQVRLMMDASDELHPTPTQEKPQMEKLVIDGITVEVPKLALELITKTNEASNAKIAKLTKDAETAIAQVEALKSRAETAEQKLKAASEPAFLAAAVAERMAVEKLAERNGLKIDGLDNHAARCAVIAKIDPKLSTTGRSPEAVSAMLDVLSTVSAAKPVASIVADTKVTDSKDLESNYRSAFFNPTKEVK